MTYLDELHRAGYWQVGVVVLLAIAAGYLLTRGGNDAT